MWPWNPLSPEYTAEKSQWTFLRLVHVKSDEKKVYLIHKFKWWNLTQALSFMWLRKIANAYFWKCKLENKGIYSKCEQPSTQKFIPMRISVAYWKLLEIVIIHIIISKLLPKFYWSGILIKQLIFKILIWLLQMALSIWYQYSNQNIPLCNCN